MKPTIPAVSIGLRPNRSPSLPDAAVMPVEPTRYAVITQGYSFTPFSSDTIRGSAVPTTVWSNAASKRASMVPAVARISWLRRRSAGMGATAGRPGQPNSQPLGGRQGATCDRLRYACDCRWHVSARLIGQRYPDSLRGGQLAGGTRRRLGGRTDEFRAVVARVTRQEDLSALGSSDRTSGADVARGMPTGRGWQLNGHPGSDYDAAGIRLAK